MQLEWTYAGAALRTEYGLDVYTIEPWHGRLILKHTHDLNGTIHDTVDLAKEYVQSIVNDAENPVPRRKGGYTLADFDKIVSGEVVLPNVSDENGINNIAALGHMLTPRWGYSLGPGGHKSWTQFFLRVDDGSGYAMVYGGQSGRIVRFAICRHQKKTHAGANHSRGWHPGHCIKCGLDLTVDSGD